MLKPLRDYYFDDSGYYAYLFLNGDLLLFKDVFAKLREDDHVRCTSAGKATRLAKNGRKYEWYIRVFDGHNDQKPTLAQVDQFFDHYNQLYPDPEALQEREERLRILQDELEQKADLLEQKIEQKAEGSEVFQEELHETRDELNLVYEELKKVEQEREQERYEFQAFSDELKQAEYDKMILQGRIDQLQAELDTYKAQGDLSEQEDNPSDGKTDLSAVIQALLPHVEFLQGSLDILTQEVDDYRDALTKIGKVAYGNERGKALHEAAGWYDLHFNHGRRATGRIYYRPTEAGYQILIGYRKDQDKDINYLKRI